MIDRRIFSLSLACLIGMTACPNLGTCKVYMTRDEGLRAAFGDSLEIEVRTAYLTEAQMEAIRDTGAVSLEAARITYHVAKRPDGSPEGYAYLDTHIVRTMWETVLVALTPNGTVKLVEILSFQEPEDYIARERWLTLLEGRSLGSDLRPGRSLPNMTGATLTARALADAVRRVLAIHGVLHDNGTKADTEESSR